MGKKCKDKHCFNDAEIKGYCVRHYFSLPRCEYPGCPNITLVKNGLCKKHSELDPKDIPNYKPKRRQESVKREIKFPKNWNHFSLEQKKILLNKETKSKLIIYILKKDQSFDVKNACKRRLLELGCEIPKDLTYKCKVPGCDNGPSSLNHYTSGFCQTHYQQYLKGIIDKDGKSIRDLVDVGKHNANISPERAILSKYNTLIKGIHHIRKELRNLRDMSFDMDYKFNFFPQLGFVEDSLKFIYSPHFILKNTSFLKNTTLKEILGEKEEHAQVMLKLDGNEYKGELIQGDESKIFITDKIDKKGSVVLFLRGIEDFTEYPFECKAYDKETNIVQNIRIEEIREDK